MGIKHTLFFSYSLQVNIKVPSSTMKVVASYSDKRHSGVSAEKLSCKWGIGLENYRETLDFMTQMNVRS